MKTLFSLCFLSLLTLTFATDSSAQVQAIRHTYASVSGLDTNSCSRTAPCRQIQKAVNTTLAGGSVTVLDSGEYQNFSVTRSMRVAAAPGITATIIATSGTDTGIRVGGTTAVNVTLKGFVVPDNTNGIVAQDQVASLIIEDCFVTSAMYGISLGVAGEYIVKNVTIKEGNYGISAFASSGQAIVTIRGLTVRGTQISPVLLSNNSVTTITDSTIDNNSDGIGVTNGATALVERCTITNNGGDGVGVDLTGTVRVSDSLITKNGGYGISNNGGTARTFSNNRITNNTSGNFSGSVLSVSLL